MKKGLVLITGASGGIGRSVALKLASIGYELALVGRDIHKLKTTSDEIRANVLSSSNTPLIKTFEIDVTDRDSVVKMVDSLIEEGRKITVLFNASGILRHGTSEISYQEFDSLMKTNLYGIFNLVHAVAPHMKESACGYIFNVASLLGKEGRAIAGGYAASKHAVVGFSDSLGRELAGKGIKVTALCPSFTDTPMVKNTGIPQEKMIQPSDIANAVEFLLSLSEEAYIREMVIECRSFIQ